jgi:hypothetical protein
MANGYETFKKAFGTKGIQLESRLGYSLFDNNTNMNGKDEEKRFTIV